MVHARFCYIVKAYSPRDGGWIRVSGTFRTEALAKQGLAFFRPAMMAPADDWVRTQIVKTV